jgi:hypothetical protein
MSVHAHVRAGSSSLGALFCPSTGGHLVICVGAHMAYLYACSDEERDRNIARHIMGVHMNANAPEGLRAAQVCVPLASGPPVWLS